MKTTTQVQKLWDDLEPCDSHPFLERNGIPATRSVRVYRDWLVIRLYAGTRQPSNLMHIDPEGNAEFLSGCETKGTYSVFGLADAVARTKTIYICDGWVNAWTVHEITGSLVISPAMQSELPSVAELFRGWFPKAKLVVCAINDRWSYFERNGWMEPNLAVTWASRAAKRVKGIVRIPDFVDLEGRPTGFNDLRLQEGSRAVWVSLDPRIPPIGQTRLKGHHVLDRVGRTELPDACELGRYVGPVVMRVVRGLWDRAERLPEDVETAIQRLRSVGLLVEKERVLLSNHGSSLHAGWDKRWPNRNWRSLIRELPGVRPTPPKYFNPNLTSRATSVPVNLLKHWSVPSL